ncbi:nuclear transport factor 2 family protein [Nocardia araoensis]|uniref:nuclear transport factor 2 family protein n=1 Tax=Nocardia araoensis TaxID=228600 RepID=UPI000308CEB1|nr:nuclear transport factor 2 family protein [Nocardia araoensis]
MSNTWSREELEKAYRTWHSTVARAAAGEGSWREFVELFTADAEYHEQMVGVLKGRDAIWAWVEPTLATFPGAAMTSFPDYWHLIDEVNGVIVVKLNNLMRDPGDGSRMGADNISILTYAGDGKFSKEEDIYNPAEFVELVPKWIQRAMELGTLSEGELEWCKPQAAAAAAS